jgi:hypothetical protein
LQKFGAAIAKIWKKSWNIKLKISKIIIKIWIIIIIISKFRILMLKIEWIMFFKRIWYLKFIK